MAIAGGTLGCYTMYLKDGELQQVKSSGNKDTVTEDATGAARRILDGGKVDVLADAGIMAEVRRLVKEGQVTK